MKCWSYGRNVRVLRVMPNSPRQSRSWCLRKLKSATMNGVTARSHWRLPTQKLDALMGTQHKERVRAFHRSNRRGDVFESYIRIIVTISCAIIIMQYIFLIGRYMCVR